MKTQQQKRTGRFTSISLISITLIGVFAAGRWFVYQHYRPSSPTNSSTAQFQTTGYLVVPEWGIKVPLSASIKDAYYTPNKLGTYEAACAELCGLGHYKMRADVKVVTQQEFDDWMAAREKDKLEQ